MAPDGIHAGEQHFIACYIIPLMYDLYRMYPRHAMPDGMKSLAGDLIYHMFGNRLVIEVKIGAVQLTKREVGLPVTMLWAIDGEGMLLIDWKTFMHRYLMIMNTGKRRGCRYRHYGPRVKISDLAGIASRKTAIYFRYGDKVKVKDILNAVRRFINGSIRRSSSRVRK